MEETQVDEQFETISDVKMKIKLISDIHLEFCDFSVPYSGEDLLIIAGDVCPKIDSTLNLIIEYIQKLPVDSTDESEHKIKVLLVLGNHDYYHNTIYDTNDAYSHVNIPGLRILQDESVVINGYRFFGATMWTDLNKRDKITMMHCYSRINDFTVICDYGPRDFCDIHEKSKQALEAVLETSQEKVVVITHHLPTYACIDKKYHAEKHINYAFCSTDLDDLVKHEKIIAWTFGHTHGSFDFYIDKTRVLCNPRGYVRKFKNYTSYENEKFDENFVFEI